jgi:hypothetical protein
MSGPVVITTPTELAALVRAQIDAALAEHSAEPVAPALLDRRQMARALGVGVDTLDRLRARHWTCSFRWGLRALLGYDKQLCAKVLAAVIQELERSLKWRAKKLLGLSTVKEALTGAVAAVQRVDSALRMNVHFHILCLDGVYVRQHPDNSHSTLTFHSLPTPTRGETEDMARRIADRVDAILKKHGRSLDPEESNPEPTEVQLEHPALAACYDAAALGVGVSGDRAGQPQLRLMLTDFEQKPAREVLPDESVAEVRGVNLYGKHWVDGRDRKQMERLARYIARPPIAQERLTSRDDGTLFLEFKKAWKDGSLGLVLQPEDLLVRLCAAVPPPRFHMLRYFGVLSSHSSYRSRVVPEAPEDATCHRPPPASGDQLELPGKQDDCSSLTNRYRWAWMLAHVFRADLETCPKCGGCMRWVEVAKTAAAAHRLMVQQGYAPQPPPSPQHGPPGQLALPFDN